MITTSIVFSIRFVSSGEQEQEETGSSAQYIRSKEPQIDKPNPNDPSTDSDDRRVEDPDRL